MKYIYLLILILPLLSSCGTLNQRKQRANKVSSELKDPLTYEQRRKFDYYFLEAVRMKQKGEYDAAFQLYTHCLDIYPQSAAVLYEISQFYMFLGQEAKGEEALKQASRSDDTNFGISRHWLHITSQSKTGLKLYLYMRIWHRYFRHVWNRCFHWQTYITEPRVMTALSLHLTA